MKKNCTKRKIQMVIAALTLSAVFLVSAVAIAEDCPTFWDPGSNRSWVDCDDWTGFRGKERTSPWYREAYGNEIKGTRGWVDVDDWDSRKTSVWISNLYKSSSSSPWFQATCIGYGAYKRSGTWRYGPLTPWSKGSTVKSAINEDNYSLTKTILGCGRGLFYSN